MPSLYCKTVLSIIFVLGSAVAQAINYPVIQAADVVETHFGITVHDPYRSLEDLSSSTVEDWANAENQLTRSILDQSSHRSQYLQRLQQIASPQVTMPPFKIGDRLLYAKKPQGKDRIVLTLKDSESSPEKPLLDVNEFPEPQNLMSVSFGPAGKFFGYVIGDNSDGQGTLHIRSLDTAQDIETIPFQIGLLFVLAPDDSGVFYPSNGVTFHKFGQSADTNTKISLGAGLPTGAYIEQMTMSQDTNWLFAISNAVAATPTPGAGPYQRYYFAKDLRKSTDFTLIAISNVNGISVGTDSLDAANGSIYRLTQDGAPEGKILRLDETQLVPSKWLTVIPETKALHLDGFSIWSGQMFLQYLRNASTQVLVKNLSNGKISELKLPGLGSASIPSIHSPYYSFNSITQPQTYYHVDPRTLESKFYMGNALQFDPSQFQTQEIFYPSKDGARVSMFVVTKKGIKLDGSTPFVLEGYGGFDISMLPSFNLTLLPWLEAGGGYALMNLRGGGEYGEAWHKAGMLGNKQNVFNDAVAAAEYLIAKGYTQASKLAIKGGSNGGLLVSAVVTQRPDLFGAAVCGVPLTDMVRFPLIGEGQNWVPEYGDPNKESDFRTLYAYSPYHHISSTTAYPAILFTTSLGDTRVTPIHAMKAAAALQAGTATKKPVLLSYQQKEGHGATTMDQGIVDAADEFGFLMDQLF